MKTASKLNISSLIKQLVNKVIRLKERKLIFQKLLARLISEMVVLSKKKARTSQMLALHVNGLER